VVDEVSLLLPGRLAVLGFFVNYVNGGRMDSSLRRIFLIAECQSMSLLLADRLGINHPWSTVNFNDVSDEELELARKLIHELLYAPPNRV
jgi:hypothetical protein